MASKHDDFGVDGEADAEAMLMEQSIDGLIDTIADNGALGKLGDVWTSEGKLEESFYDDDAPFRVVL